MKKTFLYGGIFDLVNGYRFLSKYHNHLKFAALFYDGILVPDGYFHGYGPIAAHITKIIDKPKYILESDIIIQFLRASIIVPALRSGDSLLANFLNGSSIGIIPGEFATLKKDDGLKVLSVIERVTETNRKVIPWPKDMAVANTCLFGELLYRVLVSDKSPSSLKNVQFPKQSLLSKLDFSTQSSLFTSQNIVNGFIDMIEQKRADVKFRRGEIENYFVDQLNIKDIEGNLYHHIHNLSSTFEYGVAHHLLNQVSTIYEAYHANQFKTVGGLFLSHDTDIVSHGLFDHMITFSEASPDLIEGNKEILLSGSLDLSVLSAEDIIRFRNEAMIGQKPCFELYLEYLHNLKSPTNNQTFKEANSEFIDFLVSKYIPKIIETFPKVGYFDSIAKFSVGSASALVQYASWHFGEQIRIGGFPLYLVIAPLTAAIALTPLALDFGRRVRNTLIANKFAKINNYALWRQKSIKI